MAVKRWASRGAHRSPPRPPARENRGQEKCPPLQPVCSHLRRCVRKVPGNGYAMPAPSCCRRAASTSCCMSLLVPDTAAQWAPGQVAMEEQDVSRRP
jgi:hypothetical protein